MVDVTRQPGRLRLAPENPLSEEQVRAVAAGQRRRSEYPAEPGVDGDARTTGGDPSL